jgi:glycosyltransferase involved in cell wall biosynthesis
MVVNRPLKIGIITPALDDPPFLSDAISSVPRAEGAEIDHVIIHDGSETTFRALSERYQSLRVIRGKANGPTGAADLGLRAVDADFVIQLNSDDLMVPGCVKRLIECSAAVPEIEVWSGGTSFFRRSESGEKKLVRFLSGEKETALSLRNILDDIPGVPARFCHLKMYQKIGGLDLNFSRCGDREIMLRAVIAGVKDKFLGCMVSEMCMHSGSTTLSERDEATMKFVESHIMLASHYMKKKDIGFVSRYPLRVWRANEVLRIISCLGCR